MEKKCNMLSCLSCIMFVYHLCRFPMEGRDGALDPLRLELQMVMNCCWVSGLNLGLLEEVPVFLTSEQSLHAPGKIFNDGKII